MNWSKDSIIEMKKDKYIIVFLYLSVVFFLYPVAAHILMYQLGYMTDKLPHGKFWIYTQIFFSGPALIILGLVLYFKYGKIINRILGILLITIALYWLYNIISDVINEAA